MQGGDTSQWGTGGVSMDIPTPHLGAAPGCLCFSSARFGGIAGAGAIPQHDARGFGCHNNWIQASKIVTYFSFNLPFAL